MMDKISSTTSVMSNIKMGGPMTGITVTQGIIPVKGYKGKRPTVFEEIVEIAKDLKDTVRDGLKDILHGRPETPKNPSSKPGEAKTTAPIKPSATFSQTEGFLTNNQVVKAMNTWRNTVE
ncbi:MAG: hypothetical protein HYU64_21345 [Armatimonadetes bacterium]|nr:hypothetical protein [Armatimonadota bacterium]